MRDSLRRGVLSKEGRELRAKQKKHMKNSNYLLVATATLVLLASAGQVTAGTGSCCGSCCDDGIAASPKVRTMLDERCKSKCAAPAVVTATTITRQTDVAASPKVQQMRAERTAAPAMQTTEIAGYRPTGADGITASPMVRAQLDERRQTVEIAPLK